MLKPSQKFLGFLGSLPVKTIKTTCKIFVVSYKYV